MKVLSLLFAAILATLTACVGRAPPPIKIVSESIYRLHFVMWNGANTPVAISVSIDGKVVHESVLAKATYALPLDTVVGGDFFLTAGPHVILIEDRTRGLRKEWATALKHNIDLEISLNPDGISLSDFDAPRAIF